MDITRWGVFSPQMFVSDGASGLDKDSRMRGKKPLALGTRTTVEGARTDGWTDGFLLRKLHQNATMVYTEFRRGCGTLDEDPIEANHASPLHRLGRGLDLGLTMSATVAPITLGNISLPWDQYHLAISQFVARAWDKDHCQIRDPRRSHLFSASLCYRGHGAGSVLALGRSNHNSERASR